jgi:gamma-glutamyltranspeptidase/glutathione hydrolase
VHLFAEAGSLAYADRGRYMADPDFVPLVPGLLERDYLFSRSLLIRPEERFDRAQAGRSAVGAEDAESCNGRRRVARIPVDVAPGDRRPLRQRAVDDDDDRGRLRLAADGARLPAQQRADRLFDAPADAGKPIAIASKRASAAFVDAPTIVFESAARATCTRLSGRPGRSARDSTTINWAKKTLVCRSHPRP